MQLTVGGHTNAFLPVGNLSCTYEVALLHTTVIGGYFSSVQQVVGKSSKRTGLVFW